MYEKQQQRSAHVYMHAFCMHACSRCTCERSVLKQISYKCSFPRFTPWGNVHTVRRVDQKQIAFLMFQPIACQLAPSMPMP